MLAVLIAALGIWLVVGPGRGSGPPSRAGQSRGPLSAVRGIGGPRGLPAAESGLLPWRMAAPISRAVAVAGSRNHLIVLGGLTAGGASAAGIYSLSTSTGAARRIGVLSAPLHDAAVGALGRRALVFGGGSSATVATVEAFTLHGRPGGQPATATKAGSMPAPRSDATGVTIGARTYLVGGYDGTRADAPVLATDGRPEIHDDRRISLSRCATRRPPRWTGRSSSSAVRRSPAAGPALQWT